MYRVTLYSLIFIWLAALVLSIFNVLYFAPADLIISAAFILAVCVFSDLVFAFVFEAPTNIDSVYITAAILALIISPVNPLGNLAFLAWAGILAMASKYIIAPYKKHIFNPAAIAVALTAAAISQPANWWIGNLYMAPFVLIAGLLVVRKIKRFDLVFTFFIAALVSISLTGPAKNIPTSLYRAVISSPLMFFSFIMLTEPMTTPPRKRMRIVYGALTGLLFAPSIHIGPIYSTPELALLLGNLFSYSVGPKKKFILALLKKRELSPDIFEFSFKPDSKAVFTPGQYMEWTLGHKGEDSRGIRRFFTLASSPTEKEIKLGVKFYPEPSSFKRSFASMGEGKTIVASQLAGDFTMPADRKQKLVFIGGGIGITPFRSMIKYLLDTNEPRPIVLFYSNKFARDIVYKDVFDQAEEKIGLKTVYLVTDKDSVLPNWCYTGRINESMIIKEAPDYRERIFYLSGPRGMVLTFEELLKKMGVRRKQIKTDYFPGFA